MTRWLVYYSYLAVVTTTGAKPHLPTEFYLPNAQRETKPSCPCTDQSLCQVISTPAPRWEFFGFGADNFDRGAGFDWSTITTVAWGSDADLLCEAHRHGVRVIAGVSPPLTNKQVEIEE